MHTNNSSRAYGFSGLQLYVSDIDALLDRCLVERADEDECEQTLLEPQLWNNDSSFEFELPNQQDMVQPAVHAAVGAREASTRPAKPGNSTWALGVSVAVFSLAGVATFLVMQKAEQSPAFEPAVSSLQVTEEVPPIGRGLVLNSSQIRYCIAQGIRLGAAAEGMSSTDAEAANRLDERFADYEQRCAEYRFQAGAFEKARSDVETRRKVLEREGRAFLQPRHRTAITAKTPSVQQDQKMRLQVISGEAPAVVDAPTREVQGMNSRQHVFDRTPRKYVKDLQWRLFKLQYYAGPIDGIDSRATQDALRGFFSVHPGGDSATNENAIFKAVDNVYKQLQ